MQIDGYILRARRKGGRLTEKSVLSLWRVESLTLPLHLHVSSLGLIISFGQRWVPSAIVARVIPDVIVDAHHTMAYLKYTATRRLLMTTGQDQDQNCGRLSSVSVDLRTLSLVLLALLTEPFDQSSLKKVMTMLGRVRRRQVDDDRTLDTSRPASSNRSSEFYKALMVEAQRLQLEYDESLFSEMIRPGKGLADLGVFSILTGMEILT